MPIPDPVLDERVAALETRTLNLNAFNKQVTQALQYVLEHLRNLVPLPERMLQFHKEFELYRSINTLSQASKIFPKTNTVVFVSKGYLGDNVKYAYLAFLDYARARKIDAYYLTDDVRQADMLKKAGLPHLLADPETWSLGDARALLGAKVVVLSDNFHPYTFKNPKAFGMLQGAKSLQMWHGIPIKEIGLRYILRSDRVMLNQLLASAGEFDLFVAPGGAARAEWAERFAFKDFAAAGYPRNDIFFREPNENDLLNTDRETYALFETAARSGQASILYAPTFRDDPASGWFAKAGIDRLAAHAVARGWLFAVNLHPYEQNKVAEFQQRYPGVRFLTPGTDSYPVMRHAGMLITDYSSLAFDYLLLDRPILFYRPDHESYLQSSRGIIPGNERLTPGPVATNMEELTQAFDVFAACNTGAADPYAAERRDLRDKLFDHVDGSAGKRVCENIVRMVEG